VLSAPQASSEKSEHFPVQIAVGKTEHLNVNAVRKGTENGGTVRSFRNRHGEMKRHM